MEPGKKINCILLVDDSPNDNYFHTYIIQEADVCNFFRTVYDGEEALEYIINSLDNNQDPIPDLIFLDINMPRMNGFEFLQHFETLDEALKSRMVIVMLSTSDLPSDMQKALKTKEVKEFITKPLDFEILNYISEKYF